MTVDEPITITVHVAGRDFDFTQADGESIADLFERARLVAELFTHGKVEGRK